MTAVETAEGRTMRVEEAGDLKVRTRHVSQPLDLGEALVADGLQENLLSVGAFCDEQEGNRVVFKAKKCEFLNQEGKKVLIATRNKGGASYTTKFSVKTENRYTALQMTTRSKSKQTPTVQPKTETKTPPEVAVDEKEEEENQKPTLEELGVNTEMLVASSAEEEAMMEHRKNDHLNLQELRRLAKNGGVSLSKPCIEWMNTKKKFECKDCALGKTTKKPLSRKNKNKNKNISKRQAKKLKQHHKTKVKEVKMGMDLNGPNTQATGSYPGVKWALLLRSKKSKYSWLRFLKQKSANSVYKVLSALIPLVLATLKKNRRLVILTDRSGEGVCLRKGRKLASLTRRGAQVHFKKFLTEEWSV
jgi:hypothetical protein